MNVVFFIGKKLQVVTNEKFLCGHLCNAHITHISDRTHTNFIFGIHHFM